MEIAYGAGRRLLVPLARLDLVQKYSGIEGIAPKSLVRLCNAENIFFWSGHNYAWEVVHFLGIPASEGVVRVGMAHYNSAAEVDETLESIARNIAMLRQQRRG
jgi:selenocysteine lyase/cysteine desulfurase